MTDKTVTTKRNKTTLLPRKYGSWVIFAKFTQVHEGKWECWEHSNGCYAGYSDTKEQKDYWSPCTDLNHAKLVIDRLYVLGGPNLLAWKLDDDEQYLNATSDARCYAVMEALNLWPVE